MSETNLPELGRVGATVSRVREALSRMPDDAVLHIYVRGASATVQVEWVDEADEIQNPVVLRADYELFGAGTAEVFGSDEGQR